MDEEATPEDLAASMIRFLEKRRMTANSSNIPFTEGKQAFHDGESRDANPYRSSSPGFYKWYAGYDEADQADRMDLIKMAKADDLRKD